METPWDIGRLRQHRNEWYHEEQERGPQEDHGLDASRKGQGLAKGKSESEGKGPVCWHCGVQGHPQRLCPQLFPELASGVNQKGKGKGKSWTKGKSKGAYEVDFDDYAQDLWGDTEQVQPWTVAASYARSAKDMRPCQKQWQVIRNRYAVFKEINQEDDGDESSEVEKKIFNPVNTV